MHPFAQSEKEGRNAKNRTYLLIVFQFDSYIYPSVSSNELHLQSSPPTNRDCHSCGQEIPCLARNTPPDYHVHVILQLVHFPCPVFITKLKLNLKLWSWNTRHELKYMAAEYGRERMSETVWNLLHICLSFVFRSPLWVLLLLECPLNLCNTGFNICVSNLCLLFCDNFSYVQLWLVKGQGRLERLCLIVDFTSYGKPMWTQKNFRAVFKSLG